MRLKFFKIYSRSGACVFETNNIEKGWDGRYNGELCPSGVYVYYLQYYMLETPYEYHVLKGTVNIIY